jgi:hypothetical protein
VDGKHIPLAGRLTSVAHPSTASFQGVWFNRGLGSHVLSQPAREFIVKVIEMGLYSADFLACHGKSLSNRDPDIKPLTRASMTMRSVVTILDYSYIDSLLRSTALDHVVLAPT